MTTPAGWYPDPSDISRQRYYDGKQWTEHYANYAPLPPAPPQPPPKKTNDTRVLLAVAGCIVALVIIALATGGNDDDNTTPSAASTSTVASRTAVTPPHETAPRAPEAPPAGLNQEVRDGKFAFVVTAIGTSPVAGDPSNQFMTEEAQGIFVNVRMTVTNIGNEPQTFFADNQKLIIGTYEYSPNTMAAVWSKSTSVEINPGNSVDVVVSFDVPNNPGGVRVSAIELHDSAFSGGVTVYPR